MGRNGSKLTLKTCHRLEIIFADFAAILFA